MALSAQILIMNAENQFKGALLLKQVEWGEHLTID
jgi:hypothetical protein